MTPPHNPPPSLHIAGVPVRFPFVPYRAQNALMHALVTAAKNKSHALIESPTGTGKTLALLCASLAFQHASAQGHVQTTQLPTQQQPPPVSPPAQHPHPHTPLQPDNTPCVTNSGSGADSDSDSDFAQPKKFRNVSWQKGASREKSDRLHEQPANAFMFNRLFSVERDRPLDPQHTSHDEPAHEDVASQPPTKQVPRIFYATRTHKQVAHVVSELRKTEYRPHICVLASRREYCIRDEVRELSQRDEVCKGLVKARECAQYYRAQELALHEELQGEAWDIEELTQLGRRHTACPYYASHELYQSAQIIFCPYSYLVDPIVRGARGINLSGDIVILDEAHNIENYARESAGFEADVADMRRCCEEVDTMILTDSCGGTMSDLAAAYRMLKTPLESLMTFVDNVVGADELKRNDNCEMAVFEREDLAQRLAAVDICAKEVKQWRATYEFIANFGDGNESKRKKKMGNLETKDDTAKRGAAEVKESATASTREETPVVPVPGYGGSTNDATGSGYGNIEDEQQRRRGGPRRGRRGRRRRGADYSGQEQKPWVARCMTLTHGLLTTLEYLFEFKEDFTMVVERKIVEYITVITLKIMCLNAAVCFGEISNKARSVIVTSGTLSPTGSFAGELGTKFTIVKTLPHVIDAQKQLFVTVASKGPGGEAFDATFSGCSRFSFQDSLGQALIDYCKVIPGGVLVFFPSYRLLDQLSMRWKSSGAWERLCEVKGYVLVEPSSRGEDFDRIVKQYEEESCRENGAILLGVCRGKLSEGVDFKDDSSRAVIIIGIPFPHTGNIGVRRKRMWNDRKRNERRGATDDMTHQSGAEWYETQAYRALNQALGRSVRHRYDYGAIVLADCRFEREHVLKQLPKWVRQGLRRLNSGGHEALLRSLERFYETVQEDIALSTRTVR